jgi:3-methyladenine DNA glycosylase AlkD
MQKQLIKNLRLELRTAADPIKAVKMRAYMKSEMPYYGVQTPVRNKIFSALMKDHSFISQKDWTETVKKLWDSAKFREERYIAIDLTQHKSAREFQNLKALALFEHMIVSGAWWDYVDDIASHSVGTLLKNFPNDMTKKMLIWSSSPNMWKRRTSILCQLGFGKDTDLELLYACIENSIVSKEFFLQKAIGWALRQYAWKNPREIKAYVNKNTNRLAKLSQREALKNL